MPDYMGAARVKIAQRQQAMGEMDRIIRQYKLDEENERRIAGGALATLGAEMENNPDGVASLAQSNPEFGKALNLLNEGKAKKKDMQIISASLAANTQARSQKLKEENLAAQNTALDLKNKFDKATHQNRVLATALQNDSLEIMNKIREDQRVITQAEAAYAGEKQTQQHEMRRQQLELLKQKLEENKKRWSSYPPEVQAKLQKEYDQLKLDLAKLSGQAPARTFEDVNKDMDMLLDAKVEVEGAYMTLGEAIKEFEWDKNEDKIPTQARGLWNRWTALSMERDQLAQGPVTIGGVTGTPAQLQEAKKAQDDYSAAWNALPEGVQMGLLEKGWQETAAGMSMQELRGRLADLNELFQREKEKREAERVERATQGTPFGTGGQLGDTGPEWQLPG